MKTIDADIRDNQYKACYLLYGEERYLIHMYRDKLKKALNPDGDTMNYAAYEGKNIDTEELISLADTLPFFADRRLIVVENSGFFKTSNDRLADYMKSLGDTVVFVFVESEVDKRGRMYKAVKNKGQVVEFKQQDEAVLRKWILGKIRKEERQISEGALAAFLTRVGQDMENIDSELEKLLCYTYGKAAITAEDVEAICTTQIQNKIFEMVDAIGNKDQKKAMELYYDLLILKEAPMKILALLARQFLILLQIKELPGVDRATIASKVGIPPFAVAKNTVQSKQFKREQLREALSDCAEYEEAVKTGRLGDRLCVELLIVKYSQVVKEKDEKYL